MPVHELHDRLALLPPGMVDEGDAGDVLGHLASVWRMLQGSGATAMTAEKITWERVEKLHWRAPVLSFEIERHGGTVNGSKRAELYAWEVDTESMIASHTRIGSRPLRPNAPAFDAEAAADEVVRLVAAGPGVSDPRLSWKTSTRVKINVSVVIPSEIPAQTTEGRRRRFRAKLEPRMTKAGWKRVQVGTQLVYEQIVDE